MSDLPPLHESSAYVVVAENDQRGPYPLELLIGEVLAGRLHETTPIWWSGLSEWTTIGSHPGIAAELNHRRAAYAAALAPPPGQYQQAEGYETAAPTMPVSGQNYSADMFAGDAVPVLPNVEPQSVPEPAAAVESVFETIPAGNEVAAVAETGALPIGDSVPVEVAGGVDADVPFATASPFSPSAPETQAPAVPTPDPVAAPATFSAPAASAGLDPATARQYSSLVDRSRTRAEHRQRVNNVDEQFVAAITTAAEQIGFRSAGRTDTDQRHDLRFDGTSGDLLIVSVGQINASNPGDLANLHLPATLTYRAATAASTTDPGTGAHGEVIVAADQWTGQSTASVSLFLGLEDYLGANLEVDPSAVEHDLSAAVSVLRDRSR